MIKNLKLYLIRHGESTGNILPDIVGQGSDEELTKRGKDQAKALGRYLAINNVSFDNIYCSSYTRAHQTAKIACKEFTDQFPGIVFELREHSSGDMRGSKRSEILTPELIEEMQEKGMLFKYPNGESFYDVQQRMMDWLYYLILSNPNMEGKSVGIFSHGTAIKCLLQHIMQFDQRMTWRLNLDNTSMSIIELKNGLWHIKCLNSTPHLV